MGGAIAGIYFGPCTWPGPWAVLRPGPRLANKVLGVLGGALDGEVSRWMARCLEVFCLSNEGRIKP